MSADLRAQIVAEARSLLGTRYIHQGRVPGAGLDCLGVLIVIARRLAICPPGFDVNGYSMTPNFGLIVAQVATVLTPIARDDIQLGDAVVLRVGRSPQHVGVIGDYHGGGFSYIHAAGHGVERVVEHYYDESHAQRFVAAFRFVGVGQ